MLAWFNKGTIIHSAQNVNVYGDKKKRGSVSMSIAQKPTIIHISYNVLYAIKSFRCTSIVMYCQKQARENLNKKTKESKHTEIPKIAQKNR
jgi:hypothetical protein